MTRTYALLPVAALLSGTFATTAFGAETLAAADRFREKVQPILETHCYGCHGYGSSEGGRTLDQFASDEAMLADTKLWWAVLKNVRSHMMPPVDEEQPTAEQREAIIQWIETDAFGIDPADPDPGHVTLRRLNRAEYRNTIRDLMGVDYDTEENFPPDDSGYGFDNIGDSLSLSPLLMEKYIQAAEAIVDRGVPKVSKVVPVRRMSGDDITSANGKQRARKLSYYKPADVAGKVKIDAAADYRIVVEARIDGYWEFDPARCEVTCHFNGKQLFHDTYDWRDGLDVHHEITQHFDAGEYPIRFALKPLVPESEKLHYLYYQVDAIRIEGPLDQQAWIPPENYTRFFPDGAPPDAGAERDAYARKVLDQFASRAFRRPVDEASVDKLVALAKIVYDQPDKTFEQGIGQAMVAVLSSPRFLFRVEEAGPTPPGKSHPLVDEYALASRLSYFLWTTMPDQELIELAGRGQLRANLDAQLVRMLADSRSQAFVSDFVGQWLQARDVETISIDAVAALGYQKEWEAILEEFQAVREQSRLARQQMENERDQKLKAAEESGDPAAVEKVRAEFQKRLAEAEQKRDAERNERRAKFEKYQAIREKFGDDVRRAMRRETEMTFDYVMREDRNLLELIDADYTFANERLAEYYGIPGVKGNEMRRVELPKDSPRGGLLTQGTTLVVTSNPTRTSPVKRGLFVLDNVLGTPAPPPPKAVPPLEAAAGAVTDHPASLREALDIHRKDPLCAGCHARFDPLGLALENFNALGMWRDTEHDRPIDTSGKLLTGEQFQTIGDLKKVLKNEHKLDFYRCLTEKLLTYATGRGLEYYDEPTVDAIVRRLDSEDGRFSVLLRGVVDSAPFQQQRASSEPDADKQASRDTGPVR
jgi:hypothetical protein